MNFVEELKWRGMLHQMMPGTEELLEKGMAHGLPALVGKKVSDE